VKFQILDRIAELPYRLRRPARAGARTWPLSQEELARIVVTWPAEYQWPPGRLIVETIKDGFVSLGVTRVRRIPQTHEGVHILTCSVDEQEHTVVLDYSDYHDFINEAALADCSVYIKLQFRRDGYRDSRIIRGGYMTTGSHFYRYYLPFRRKYLRDKRIDVVGRFGFRFQGDLRRKAVALLSAANDLHFVGSAGKVRYSRFLRETAAARLCLHMPGNGAFTHRVAEFLGLGSCMVSIRFTNELHVPLEPGVHYVDISDDLSDLVDKCRYYIAHPREREEIAAAGREYFDRYLHYEQLAAYHARTILDRLGKRKTADFVATDITGSSGRAGARPDAARVSTAGHENQAN
jgi:hypothetical protein